MSSALFTPSRRSSTKTTLEHDEDEFKRRVLDVVVSLLTLVVLAPLLAVIAGLIKLESPGPVFFSQKRVGKDGRLFEMFKFRSMRSDPPSTAAIQDVGDIESFQFRPVGRKTAIGRALRACSLDEMGNLLNVLRGDMHLVGPRPDEPELVAQYLPEWRRRHEVKPGLTGLAQIMGRTDLTYQEMMTYDLDYVARHSFKRDVLIMLKTFGVVARREGAR